MDIQPDIEYQKHLQEGRFMIQRCRTSGRHVFYPRVAEPGTGDRDLEWVQASGLGTVYSTTIARVKPPAPAYTIVLVDLEEGPRMMSRVEGIDPAAVKIGMKVQAKIAAEGERRFVVFEPA
jgi:uncharacterized OB-fold protein